MRRLRHQGDGVWTADRLQTAIETCYQGESIVVLANREPFQHDRAADGRVRTTRSASGLVTALEPLVRACGGVWVAHGSGTADRAVVDDGNGVGVPPGNPEYRLRRVWLDADEERRYYFGFANEGLWPLCHRVHVKPIFRSEDFRTYSTINARFADAVIDEARSGRPLIFVQDYHFAIAPALIHDRLPDSTIVAFWHIPWPEPRQYAICPWARRLLEGLLGSTIVGVQTPDDAANFMHCVEALVDAEVDYARGVVTHARGRTLVRAYPVSVEWPSRIAAQAPPTAACRADVRRALGLAPDVQLGVGVDRLDYTKGIEEKFLAVEQLLESRPEFRERFVFAQIAEPSRTCLPAYRALRARVRDTRDRINARFGARGYRPLLLLEHHHEPQEVYRFLRAADVCYVGSLHDGMNLVAKEFVSARNDGGGVLVLSEFAGAARELADAVVVNPYAIDDAARALARALRMPGDEQSRRMRAMRSVVARFSTYRWAGAMLADAARLRASIPRPSLVRHGGWRAQMASA
jgi:trehalose 6-phosphate synthase